MAAGQTILHNIQKAKSMLQLVVATAPEFQTGCRWDALHCLEEYLRNNDPIYLAHQVPEELLYPVPILPPMNIRRIDGCLFYLDVMWMENQVMEALDDEMLGEFWDKLPTDWLNQCEQVVINGLGKAVLAPCWNNLLFNEKEYDDFYAILKNIL